MKPRHRSNDPVADPVAKVRRAALHLEALHNEIRTFAHSDPRPYRFGSKVDKKSSHFVVHLAIDREPPSELSLIAGDFVQNAREALDHLIWQLVIANGEMPSRRNAFPLLDHRPPDDAEHRARKAWDAALRGVSPTAVAYVEACQPYHGEDGPDHHVLSALRSLSNEDKHRNLLRALTAIQAEPDLIEIEIVSVSDVEPVGRAQVYANRPLEHMDLVVAAPVTITGPDPEVEMRGDLPLDVGFG